jgi:hypothetical protein
MFEEEGYRPAPLDELSFWNGVAKFEHELFTVSNDEFKFALDYLNFLFPLLQVHSRVFNNVEAQERISRSETKNKASGYPWRHVGAHTKLKALEKWGADYLTEYYAKYTSVLSSTLKDEIRPVGKDARFFRPVDVAAFLESVKLFSDQNDYLMEQSQDSPIFIKYQTPGPDLCQMFKQLFEFSNDAYGADGSRWDACFPLFAAQVICAFRSQFLPKERTERYYAQMYNGYTNCLGNIVPLTGQPSGHLLTSLDNSLCHCVLVALHAFRNGISMDMISEHIVYKCCGDDLIYSTRNNAVFKPIEIANTYHSVGCYMEFENMIPWSPFALSFCGVRSCFKDVNGVKYRLYRPASARAKVSFNHFKRKADPLKRLSKMTSLSQLLFCDEVLFELCRKATQDYCVLCFTNALLSPSDPCVRGLMASLTDRSILEMYTRWE